MMMIQNGVKTQHVFATAFEAQSAMDKIEYDNQFRTGQEQIEFIVDTDPALELEFMQSGQLVCA
jgi:hypothetical protein